MAFRFEEKIKLNLKKKFLFKEWLNSQKSYKIYPDREVYSIYFDNNSFQTYLESVEGIVPRKKFRLRTYNFKNLFSNKFNIEIKESLSFGRKKNSKKIEKIENLLLHGIFFKNYGICYPKIIVKYLREYYVLSNNRLTLDSNIAFKKFDFYNKSNISFKSFNSIVAEIKSDSINNINEVNKDLPFEKTRFSKYCFGIESFFNL